MTDIAKPKRVELTLRALVLGSLLAVVFTAANVYLGLQVGLTFASSIPAAVISMALLRAFKTSTIWENMTGFIAINFGLYAWTRAKAAKV